MLHMCQECQSNYHGDKENHPIQCPANDPKYNSTSKTCNTGYECNDWGFCDITCE